MLTDNGKSPDFVIIHDVEYVNMDPLMMSNMVNPFDQFIMELDVSLIPLAMVNNKEAHPNSIERSNNKPQKTSQEQGDIDFKLDIFYATMNNRATTPKPQLRNGAVKDYSCLNEIATHCGHVLSYSAILVNPIVEQCVERFQPSLSEECQMVTEHVMQMKYMCLDDILNYCHVDETTEISRVKFCLRTIGYKSSHHCKKFLNSSHGKPHHHHHHKKRFLGIFFIVMAFVNCCAVDIWWKQRNSAVKEEDEVDQKYEPLIEKETDQA